MVKKLQKLAEKKNADDAGFGGVGALLDSELARTVRDSAQQIWLAGLGAFTRAQGDGAKAFDALVQQGAAMHRKTQAVAEEKIGEVATRMTSIAGDVGSKAGQHWDKLESIFEERVAKALAKLGVPSNKEVQALNARIEALQAALASLPDGAAALAAVQPAAAVRAATGNGTKPATKTAAGRAKAPAKTTARSATKAPTAASSKAPPKAAPKASAKPPASAD